MRRLWLRRWRSWRWWMKRGRMERVRRRAMDWKTNHLCRGIILELMEAAGMEAEWRKQSCTELVLEVVEVAVMESRMKQCK